MSNIVWDHENGWHDGRELTAAESAALVSDLVCGGYTLEGARRVAPDARVSA